MRSCLVKLKVTAHLFEFCFMCCAFGDQMRIDHIQERTQQDWNKLYATCASALPWFNPTKLTVQWLQQKIRLNDIPMSDSAMKWALKLAFYFEGERTVPWFAKPRLQPQQKKHRKQPPQRVAMPWSRAQCAQVPITNNEVCASCERCSESHRQHSWQEITDCEGALLTWALCWHMVHSFSDAVYANTSFPRLLQNVTNRALTSNPTIVVHPFSHQECRIALGCWTSPEYIIILQNPRNLPVLFFHCFGDHAIEWPE